MKLAGELSRCPSRSSQYGTAIRAWPVSQCPVSGRPPFQCTAPMNDRKFVIAAPATEAANRSVRVGRYEAW